MGISFWKRFHDAIVEAVKALLSYFEVLHLGFVKKPGDANLVFCSCILESRMETYEKTEGDLLIRCLIDEQTITLWD